MNAIYFMLWRDDEKRMMPVADFKNRLVLYVSYYMAEADKPALGTLTPITHEQSGKIVKKYNLSGIKIRNS